MSEYRFQGEVRPKGPFAHIYPHADSPPEILGLGESIILPRNRYEGDKITSAVEGEFVVQIEAGKARIIESTIAGATWKETTAQDRPPTPNVQRPPKPDQHAEVETVTEGFVHPYNFVRLPKPSETLFALPAFRRGPSAAHDRFDAKSHSGVITCTLSLQTHTFIPSAHKVHLDNSHATLGYFTLRPPSETWNHNDPAGDRSPPALPASSIRGMIRSIFECATLSCFSIFDDEPLDFRIPKVPDACKSETPLAGRGRPSYVPCRLLAVSEDQRHVDIQLLNGCFDGDDQNTMSAALIHCYEGKVKSGQGPSLDLMQLSNVPDGGVVAVRISVHPQEHRSRQFQYRLATKPLALSVATNLDETVTRWDREIDQWTTDKPINDESERVVLGFFHRTGPNFPNKHYERIFFDATANYNAVGKMDQQKIREFVTAHGLASDVSAGDLDSVRLPTQVAAALLEHLRGYADRNGKKIDKQHRSVPRQWHVDDRKSLPSDFVAERPEKVRLSVGSLYFALIEQTDDDPQGFQVRGLYPTALPRLTHEASRGDLLPDHLYPCSRQHERCAKCDAIRESTKHGERTLCSDCNQRHQRLCPACRVFGWVRQLRADWGLRGYRPG